MERSGGDVMQEFKNLKDLPEEDYLTGGSSACAGCGPSMELKLALKALGPDTLVVNASGCMTLLPLYPNTPLKVSWIHNAIENAASTAAGARHGLDMLGEKDMNIVVYAGDGATYDIGFASLSSVATKNERIIYICYNNQSYGNTGFQWSTATPYGSETKTTPRGKENPIGTTYVHKDMMKIMGAHRVYAATASLAYPVDFLNKLVRAKERGGFSYIEILGTCSTGWNFDSRLTVKVSRLAVRCGMWPLYEIEDGVLTLNKDFNELKPISEFLKLQGRFKALPPEGVDRLQTLINEHWAQLKEYNGQRYV
ncbi:MAG: thiamine pyrophosphate-dependent enzyme [ANME-2 cluster archaeon]|nr:thiamine pyrophosphate-dependent enzyme [ANME-2 cluster archaeon]